MKNVNFLPPLTLVAFILLSAFTGMDGRLTVDPSASKLKWTGYHLGKSYEHYGLVTLKKGNLEIRDGKITAGEFVIDMNSITVEDVPDAKDNAKLVNHLKSDDFFSTKKYPEARLVITGSEPVGTGKLKTTGNLTIRGITKPIAFETTLVEKNGTIEAYADLKIQRTDFKVMYGWKVENAILAGEFRMEVNVVAR